MRKLVSRYLTERRASTAVIYALIFAGSALGFLAITNLMTPIFRSHFETQGLQQFNATPLVNSENQKPTH